MALKDYNNLLVTKHKDMELYVLYNKEFKIAVLRTRDLPDPGIEPASLHLASCIAGGFSTTEQPQGSNVYVHFGFVAKHIW